MAGNMVEILFRGDNRSLIRSLKEISAQSEKTSSNIKHGNEEAASSMDKVRHSSTLLRDSVAGLAGMVGFGGLAFGLKDAIQGGIQLQTAQTQLRASLHGSASAFKALNDQAVRMSTHGGFTTTQNIQAITSFVRETHSASEATNLFALATNIARGRNMDLASAQTVVARAYTGSVGRLQQLLGPMVAQKDAMFGLTQAHKAQAIQLELESRSYGKLGPIWLKQQEMLDGITPKMAALATLQDKAATAKQVIAAAQTVFGGATEAFSGTTAGKLSNLQHALQNTTDQLGLKLLPVVNRLAGIGLTVVNWFSRLPGPLQAAVIGFSAFAALMPFINRAREAFSLLGKITGITAAKEAMLGDKAEVAAGKEVLLGDASEAVAVKEGVSSAGGGGVGSLGLLGKFGEKFGLKGALGTAAKFAGPIGLAAMGLGTAINHVPFLSFLKHAPIIGGLSSILGFNQGGVVPKYMAAGGPMGSDTQPAWLTPGEGVLSLRGMQALGDLNAGGGGMGGDITIRVPVSLDSRVLTEAVARYSLNRAARGPTSFVGGSLVTGSPGF